jgi:hypothetical protein
MFSPTKEYAELYRDVDVPKPYNMTASREQLPREIFVEGKKGHVVGFICDLIPTRTIRWSCGTAMYVSLMWIGRARGYRRSSKGKTY